MSNEMITQLPTVTSALSTDIIYAVQGYVSPSSPGTSVQETLQQVMNLVQSNVVLNYAGNPNGNLAGTVNVFCWDTADNFLWICTTTGSASTAVWKTVIGTPLNGQLPIGSTGNAPSLATITAGTNISVANSSGAITISATGLAGIGWTNVTTSTFSLVADNGYVADKSTLVTFTLPVTAAFGTFIYIQGLGSGGWQVNLNTGQQIAVGSAITTVTTGSIASTNQYDSITLLCVTANTLWTSLGAPQSSGLTIV